MKTRRQIKHDLLATRPFRALLRSPAFPLALQGFTLASVLLLVINGWGIGLAESPQQLMLLRKTNLTTLFVWGVWWPGMIAMALAFGRLWCTVCPMELINRLGEAIGRRLGWTRFKIGRRLRAGWLIVLAYLVLQLLVAGFSIHRVPHYTSLMLLALLGAALLSGLIFNEQRSFCKTICPAGALLSVYGRYTPLQLDIQNPEVCNQCNSRDCTASKNRFKFDARSCPSLLRPYVRQQGDACVLCLQCAKVCPRENLGFGVVQTGSSSRQHRLLKPYETIFVIIVAGFVAHEVIGEVKVLDAYFHAVPRALNFLAPSIGFGWFEALWFLFLFPLFLWMGTTGLAYLLGYRGGLKTLLIAAATGAAPVVAIAHLSKAAAKVSSWGGFIPLSIADPTGLETLRQMLEEKMLPPSALVSLSAVGFLMLIVMIIIGWRSMLWLRESAAENLPAARAGFVSTIIFFCLVLGAWPWF